MRQLEECRTYADHLRSEHRQIQKQVRGVEIDLAALQDGAPSAALRSDLVQLRERLAHHFAEEEGGGCLEEAVSQCPCVASQADTLLHEHPALLHELDEVIAELRRGESQERLEEIRLKFERLCRKLLAHEGAENHVLHRAFGVSVNGEGE
jgi:hypothetical protein